ncbi:MAG: hypothetical protein GY725_25365 [bacterium]|nr:hypothetical protein [bacterium]
MRQVLGRRWIILTLGLTYLVSQLTILSIIEPLDRLQVFRLQTALSPEAFLAIKQSWVDAGVLDAYWRHFVVDFPHPLWYGLFLAACAASALNFSNRPDSWNALIVLPVVAGACDFVENSFHVVFLLEPAAIAHPWIAISGLFSHVKWLLLASSILISVALCATGARIRIAKRHQL